MQRSSTTEQDASDVFLAHTAKPSPLMLLAARWSQAPWWEGLLVCLCVSALGAALMALFAPFGVQPMLFGVLPAFVAGAWGPLGWGLQLILSAAMITGIELWQQQALSTIALHCGLLAPLSLLFSWLGASWFRATEQVQRGRLSERLMHAALEQSADAIEFRRPDGRPLFVNPAWTKLSGYQWDEVRERSVLELIRAPEAGDLRYQRAEETLRLRQSWQGELSWRRKDGRIISHHTKMVQILEDKEELATIVIRTDLSRRKALEHELSAFHALPDTVMRLDFEGNLLSFKAPFDPKRERSLSIMLGVSLLVALPPDMMPEDIAHRLTQAVRYALQVGQAQSLEYTLRTEDQRTEQEARLIPNQEQGEVMVLIRDISERKKLQKALELTQHSFRSLIERNKDGIIIIDQSGVIRFTNPAAQMAFRQHGGAATGTLFDFPLVVGTSSEIEIVREVRRGGFEVVGVGEMRVMETEWVGETAYLASIRDITERKEAEKKLAHQAYHDLLTGLPNRAKLLARLEHSIMQQASQPSYMFGVLFMDLDRFKNVNDSLGHDAGDQLLMELALRLGTCIGVQDTVARLGGDEFVFLLEQIKGPGDASRVAERILEMLSSPFHIKGQEIFSSGSIGIALSSIGYEKPQDILRDADTAMYHAKALGRSRYVVFDKGMHQKALRLLKLENDLQRAVEQNEFVLHFQPIHALQTGLLVGFEVLVRWMHPTEGLTFPGDFIEIAEDTGMIVPIGWWVMREACRQMRVWQLQFPENQGVTMSVNLSAKQFAQRDLVERVLGILAETGLPPRSLKVEITESALIQGVDDATSMLKQLRAQHIQVHMDDFGTGYSSLSYLHQFPVDALKIDRAFVSKMEDSQENAEIVKAIVSMAQSLRLTVTAEGVENPQQMKMLRALGCERMQGYGISKPVDVQSATMMVQQPDWFLRSQSPAVRRIYQG